MRKTVRQEHREEIERVIEEMAQRWGSTVVARKDIGRYTGGAITAKTAANLDSLGTGCPGRFSIGASVVYPVDNLSQWLKSRIG